MSVECKLSHVVSNALKGHDEGRQGQLLGSDSSALTSVFMPTKWKSERDLV